MDSSQKSEIDFAVMEERLVMWGQDTHALVHFNEDNTSAIVPIKRLVKEDNLTTGHQCSVLWSNRKKYAGTLVCSGSMNVCAAIQEELEESDEESNSDNDGSKQILESTLTDHESKELNKAASSKRQSKGRSGKENKKPKSNGKPRKRLAKEQTVKPKKKEKKDFQLWIGKAAPKQTVVLTQASIPPALSQSQSSVPPALSQSQSSVPPSQTNVPLMLSQTSVPQVLSQSSVPPLLSQSSVPPVLSQSSVPPLLSQSSVPLSSQSSVPLALSQSSVPPALSQSSVSPALSQTSVPPALSQTNVPMLSHTSVPQVLSQSSVPPVLSQSSVPPVLSQTSVPPTLSQSSVPPALSQSSVSPALSQSSVSLALSQSSVSPALSQSSVSPALSQTSVPPTLPQSSVPVQTRASSAPHIDVTAELEGNELSENDYTDFDGDCSGLSSDEENEVVGSEVYHVIVDDAEGDRTSTPVHYTEGLKDKNKCLDNIQIELKQLRDGLMEVSKKQDSFNNELQEVNTNVKTILSTGLAQHLAPHLASRSVSSTDTTASSDTSFDTVRDRALLSVNNVTTKSYSRELLSSADITPIYTKSRSRHNFAALLVKNLFDVPTRMRSNVAGRGKEKLDPEIIKYVKEKVFEYYECNPAEVKKEWKRCVTAIDEKSRALRKLKGTMSTN